MKYAITAILLLMSGCSYYAQAINGQLDILDRQKPISDVIDNPDTPEKLRNRLKLVQEIRDFAINELKLPGKKHFTKYADLERKYVIWNLVATPEFSLTPKKWNYPFIGYAEYRGYFSKQMAEDYAAELRTQGFDVYLGGVTAYSTLGWFDDPVLNTFVYYDDINLAALIFHELAHQVLYVSDDTTFNESFAAAVEEEGVRRWLESRNNGNKFSLYKKSLDRNRDITSLARHTRLRLNETYRDQIPVEEKRLAKRKIFQDFIQEYEALKRNWGGYAGYDAMFSGDLNNAHLLLMAYYNDLVPDFLSLLKQCDEDLERFYKECRRISRISSEKRRKALQGKNIAK